MEKIAKIITINLSDQRMDFLAASAAESGTKTNRSRRDSFGDRTPASLIITPSSSMVEGIPFSNPFNLLQTRKK